MRDISGEGRKRFMQIDRKKIREQFASYTRNYDPEDPKIALKIAHTYRVADNCEEIAGTIGLSDEDIEFAWLSGMPEYPQRYLYSQRQAVVERTRFGSMI